MKNLVLILTLLLSSQSWADLYVGGQYGLTNSSLNRYEEKNVNPKGPNYGGFIGAYSKFVGLEGFYSSFKLESELKHDDEEYTLKDQISAVGMALRFSFSLFYLRGGLASFTVKESVDATGQEADEINQIYKLIEDDRKSGVMFGGGLHFRMTKHSRIFLDFTRYQISGYGNLNTVSAGLAFLIPTEMLSLPDKEF